MRRLALTLVCLVVAGVGADVAHASHRNELVLDAAGDLTPEAGAILYNPSQEVPHYLMTQTWTTEDVHIAGQTVPAGTQLTKTQFAALRTDQLSSVTETRPANAIPNALQTRVDNAAFKVRRAGRAIAGLKAYGPMALVGASVAIPLATAAIEMTIPGQGTIYKLWTGHRYSSGTPTGVLTWTCLGASPCSVSSISQSGFALRDSTNTDFILRSIGLGSSSVFCAAASTTGCNRVQDTTAALSVANTTQVAPTGATTACGTTTPANSCIQLTRTEAQMEAATTESYISQDEYNAHTDKRSITYNQPTFTSGDDAAIADAIATQTDAMKDLEDSLGEMIEPGSAPTTTTGTGTGTSPENPTYIEPPPTTVPTGEGFDFSPITDIDFGCKFPYGLLCYAVAFTELFDVEPDAPVFSFTLGFQNELGGGTAPYAVDLSVMDDYMSLWRTILSVCLWVGAVYWLASRLLGFNAAGDPGDAIEDVL